MISIYKNTFSTIEITTTYIFAKYMKFETIFTEKIIIIYFFFYYRVESEKD